MAKQRFASGKAARRRARKRKSTILARAKREFTYQGHTLEQLQAMPLTEFMALVPSRVRRSLERGWTEGQRKLLEDVKREKHPVLRTHDRDMPIIPLMVGRRIAIHNGKEFQEVLIQPEMLGHYLGEFALSRKDVKHTGPGVGATRSSKYLPLK
jgi:small subunit ribosomal protein S19